MISHPRPALLSLVALSITWGACHAPQPLLLPAPPPQIVTAWPGVDSVVAAAARVLADAALVPPAQQVLSQSYAERGLTLTRMADSLLGRRGATPAKDSVSLARQNAAIAAYNAGADALNAAADADSVTAAGLLGEAADAFRLALDANPYDEDAHYWLARVYEIQSEQLKEAGAVDAAIALLKRLVGMHQQRHDYVALLADAYERYGTVEGGFAAGLMWDRATKEAIDDALLSGEAMDSTTIFTYHARAARAYVMAEDGALALTHLSRARGYAQSADDLAYIETEQEWLDWDAANVVTRTRYDALLLMADTAPASATEGLRALAAAVHTPTARVDVHHAWALVLYQSARPDDALRLLGALWHSAEPQAHIIGQERVQRIREDYGTLAFNTAVELHEDGDVRATLGYLLQSEATEFSQAGKAALEVALLLRNDVPAALEAAHRAERRMAQLSEEDKGALLRYLVELYRRAGDRDRAAQYAGRLQRPP